MSTNLSQSRKIPTDLSAKPQAIRNFLLKYSLRNVLVDNVVFLSVIFLILRLLNSIVTILFGVYLVLWLFQHIADG
jgi:hypothetical protein